MSYHASTPKTPITYITDEPPHPSARWPLARHCALLLATVGLAAMTACSVSIGTDDSAVESTSDITIGDCLQIDDEADDQGNVRATTIACDADGLTFYAAETVAADADCAGDNSASLSFDGDPQKLCMTPNFVDSRCYQIPLPGGQLVDYRESDCAAPAATDTVIAKAVTRSDDSITCAADQTAWVFSEPEAIGYCLRAVEPA
ncbi:pyridine nucleotide-disulfide oxidoreductase [Gordonia sp. NPDC062954]|uniref:pyridine nucleotide-disulfide oxidoreductase n=1 Tax=Gordonia sp. NPDC062954 TaxID=3364003 RepID=UPI0037C6C678